MPPASVHQILLQTLAVLAAFGVAVRLRAGTGRTVISDHGRVVPLVVASATTAIMLSVTFQPHALWIHVISSVGFALGLGAMIQLSTRWDSYLSVLTQASATWSSFGIWMLAHDAVFAYSAGNPFWHPWNSIVCTIQVLAGVFFAAVQAAAIRAARARARRPLAIDSAAVVQRDGLGSFRSVQAG